MQESLSLVHLGKLGTNALEHALNGRGVGHKCTRNIRSLWRHRNHRRLDIVWNPGHKEKCPTVEEVWEKVQEEMGDELCVFQQIGWLDESYEFDNATAVADIASLPQEVSMALDENDMGECVESVMEYMGEDKKMAKCWDKYSEEDQEALMGMGYLTASVKCFLDGFMDACGEHVKAELMNAYFSQAAGRR